MATALKDKLEQAKDATALQMRPSVLQLFKDESLKKQLAVSIPPSTGLTVDRLLLVAFNEIRRNPDLGDCTRDSFMGALLLAGRLGLEIGGPLGHFHLVPFRNTRINAKEVTPILGYKGMIVLARRSGEIASIAARPVRAKDYFDFSYGLEDRLTHRPAMDEDRGEIVAFYGIARFTNGGVQPLVMSKKEVDAYRKRSKAAAASSGPWETDYEQMGAKTVIRRMAPFLPLTVEVATAIAEDEERDEGRTPEMANLNLGDFATGSSSEPAKTEPAASQGESGELPSDAGGEEAAGASAGNPVAQASTPVPPAAAAESATDRIVCQICGLEDGKHDDAKHAEWAKAKRAEKKKATETDLPLEGQS